MGLNDAILNKHEENKKTENNQALPVSQVGWIETESTGRFNYPRKTKKLGPFPAVPTTSAITR